MSYPPVKNKAETLQVENEELIKIVAKIIINSAN